MPHRRSPVHELFKCHDIVFHSFPPGQAEQAAQRLQHISGVSALAFPHQNRVLVTYVLGESSLAALLQWLQDEGFHIDNNLLQKLHHALITYCEAVQLENLAEPAKPTKSHEAYSKVYEQHLHGDHDDTPEELRRAL